MRAWGRLACRVAVCFGLAAGVVVAGGATFGAEPGAVARAIVSTSEGEGGEGGLVLLELELASGKLVGKRTLHSDRAGMLAWHREHHRTWLFATGTKAGQDAGPNGTLRVYRLHERATSAALTQVLSTRGRTACFVDVDPTGRHVFISNFRQDDQNSRGSIVRFPRTGSGEVGDVAWRVEHSGSGPRLPRQAASHPHSIKVSPSGRFVAVGDLGIDRVVVYTLDPESGEMVAFDEPGTFRLEPGSGPRHIAMSPDERFLYVINENAATVTAFAMVGEDGKLDGSRLQTLSTLAPGEKTSACADLEMHPSGRYLYGSNRGPDDLVAYRIDPDSGQLTLIDHVSAGGRNPREFAIDPSGRLLVVGVKDPDHFRIFRIDPETGALSERGHSGPLTPGGGVVFLDVAQPD